jgi:hypothetical protein
MVILYSGRAWEGGDLSCLACSTWLVLIMIVWFNGNLVLSYWLDLIFYSYHGSVLILKGNFYLGSGVFKFLGTSIIMGTDLMKTRFGSTIIIYHELQTWREDVWFLFWNSWFQHTHGGRYTHRMDFWIGFWFRFLTDYKGSFLFVLIGYEERFLSPIWWWSGVSQVCVLSYLFQLEVTCLFVQVTTNWQNTWRSYIIVLSDFLSRGCDLPIREVYVRSQF